MEIKSLKDLGVRFDPKSGCNVCDHNFCSNISTCTKTGNEYYVIIKKYDNGTFSVIKLELPDTCSTESETFEFSSEKDVVSYLVNGFESFRDCF